jgi:hypothetical protein
MSQRLYLFVFGLCSIFTAFSQQDSTDLATLTIGASVNNYTALISKIDLEIAQTLKYPGVFFDPARLAMAKAGVVNDNDQANGLAIRGNSPNALQWRLEGAIILNPNHLANASNYNNEAANSSGGVNMLSTQMLGTSSLVMGGFTAEYNNALSGVMDMRLRNGRSDQRHYVAQLGLIGTDLSAEGALTKNKRWTYLANYRYSTVGLLSKLGVNFGGEQTAFQDLAATITYTSSKNWAAKFFFMAGKSHNYFTHDTANQEIKGYRGFTDLKYNQTNIIGGITWAAKTNNEGEWKITLAQSFTEPLNQRQVFNTTLYDTLNIRAFRFKDSIRIITLSSIFAQYSKKINQALSFRLGANLNFAYSYYNLINYLDTTTSGQANVFVDLLWNINHKTQLIIGNQLEWTGAQFGSKYSAWGITFYRNHSTRLGHVWLPRVNFLYRINPKQSLMLAYNKSSYLDYFAIKPAATVSHNLNLKYTLVRAAWRSYIEMYYQNFNYIAPYRYVQYEVLQSQQMNRGIVIGTTTHQQTTFLDVNFIIYDAQIRTSYLHLKTNETVSQQINAPFNGRFAFNLTSGKEWQMKKKRTFGINTHLFYNGGMPQSPAYSSETTLYAFPTSLYNQRFPNYFRLDTRIYLNRTKNNRSATLSLDIQNITNNKVQTGSNYDTLIMAFVSRYQVGMIPILNYRLTW